MKLELKSAVFLTFGFLAGVIATCLVLQKDVPARNLSNSTPTFTAKLAANLPTQKEASKPDIVFFADDFTNNAGLGDIRNVPSAERVSHKKLFPTGVGKALIDSRPAPAVQFP